MTSKGSFSPEEWTLLGLAGAFNTEQARWSIRKADDGGWEVTRETDEVWPHDVEVKAHRKTNGEAHQLRRDMEDMAAAKAFLIALTKAFEEK